MITRWRPALLVLAATMGVSCSEGDLISQTPDPSKAREQVVYGEDDRVDLYEVTDPFWYERATSTAALIRSSNLSDAGDGRINISTQHYGQSYGLCAEEPFFSQETAAFCSGFLVAPDVLVTAGHCIQNETSCKNTSYVFGFALNAADSQPRSVPASEVYNCSELISSVYTRTGDYAVIRLDRPVEGHQPLAIRREGQPASGTGLVVIGHPAGLPTKIAGGAQVRTVLPEYFVANLDTYGGNSGSAVFNGTTGEVEGILVRGEVDYTYRNGCRVSNVCTDDGCRGEDVTRIDLIHDHIK